MAKLLKTYKDFSGGLSEVANDQMADNQLAVAINVVPGASYGIAKANGTSIAMPRINSGETIIKLVELKPQDGAAQMLAFTADKLYRLYDTAWAPLIVGIQTIKDWFIHANKLWWLDGLTFWQYDGAQITEVLLDTSSPQPADEAMWARLKTSTCVEMMDGRWFYARPGSNEVIFTAVGKPNDIKATQIFNFDTRNAETITALQVFNKGLLVFKPSSVDYLTSGDFTNLNGMERVPLNVTSGTAFPDSVCLVENAVLYLGYNGVYRLRVPSMTTIIAAENISEFLISDTLKAFTPSAAFATVWDGVYHLYVKNGAGEREYRYYQKLKAFYGPYTQDIACYAPALTTDKALYLGCPNGYILKYDEASHDYVDTATGEPRPVVMTATTKGYDVTNSMVRDAKLKRVQVVAKQYLVESSHLHVFIKADYAEMAFDMDFDESLVWGEGDWGSTYWGWKDTVVKEFTVGKKAKRMQITFENDRLGEPVLIYGVGCVFKPKRPKGSREGVSKGVITYED